MINASGQIVIMTTHDLSIALHTDKMILLGEQGIIAHGPTRELMINNEVWEQTGLSVPDWILSEMLGSHE
jgi:ABC-type cobalamin/Fe3+-siderophores transport system ATPase subunit